MDERQLRLACLQLASHPDKHILQILTEAQRLYEFIMGKKAGE